MRIEVTKEIDKHTRQTWQFNMFDLNIVFVGYLVEEKPPRKRTWKIVKIWDKYSSRHENSLEEPTLQEHIKQEAIEITSKRLKVFTWEEWKR